LIGARGNIDVEVTALSLDWAEPLGCS